MSYPLIGKILDVNHGLVYYHLNPDYYNKTLRQKRKGQPKRVKKGRTKEGHRENVRRWRERHLKEWGMTSGKRMYLRKLCRQDAEEKGIDVEELYKRYRI